MALKDSMQNVFDKLCRYMEQRIRHRAFLSLQEFSTYSFVVNISFQSLTGMNLGKNGRDEF